MSNDPNESNPPEQPSNPSNGGGYPEGNPGYPPVGGPGYPPPGNPGYPPAGGPGYPPVDGPGYPFAGGPGYPPPFPNQPYPGYIPPPQFTPKPLGETLKQLPRQYWRVLSHPRAATFVEEQAYASWGAIWVQIFGLSVLGAIAITFYYTVVYPALINGMAQLSNVPAQNNGLSQMTNQIQAYAIPIAIFAFIFEIAGAFIGTGIYWLIAKAFRGQGPFLQYMYCYMLIYVPTGIVIYILMQIPIVGVFLILIPAIYALVLLIMMTSGVHRMSGGKATLAVLILPIILIILSCILSVVIFSIALNAVHSIQTVPTN